MFQINSITYSLAVITLVMCAACGSHKKPIKQQQKITSHYESNIMHQVRMHVEGVECSGCVEDVLTHLKKIPGVQMAAFIGRYDACEQGYFSFYFPADEDFDMQAFNATIAVDGFSAKLYR